MIDMMTGRMAGVWTDGRGPLRFLPKRLFEDRRPAVAILLAWLLALGGSAVLAYALSFVAPENAGPDFGEAPAIVLMLAISLFSPVVETLMMAGLIELLLRRLRPWQIVLVSAITWGVLHSLMAPFWGLVIWWPFLIFSTVYITWRGRGFWVATAVAGAVHVLQNIVPAAATVLGY